MLSSASNGVGAPSNLITSEPGLQQIDQHTMRITSYASFQLTELLRLSHAVAISFAHHFHQTFKISPILGVAETAHGRSENSLQLLSDTRSLSKG